jgi:hypothetical protein
MSAANLAAELALLRSANRDMPAGSTLASPFNALEDDTIHTLINANAPGDNLLISPPGQRMAIMELFLWNVAGSQTIILKDGQLPLFRISAMPAASGFVLGFSGTGKAHFRVTAGNPLILNLSTGTLVDGFIKYRVTG